MGINSSGERGIKMIIYYLKNPRPGQDEHEKIIYRFQPIMFLSKRFTAAEKNYKVTEFEIADLV
jgi:hypothetical protein